MIEIKAVELEAIHVGQLALYISAVDKQLKHETDNKTIGILLCKSKDRYVAEYVLDVINAPIGISEYKLTEAIPDNIKSNLPSIEEIEEELKSIENKEDDHGK